MILQLLLHKFGTKAAVGRRFGIKKAAVGEWFAKGRVPEAHWRKVTKYLPGITIDQCHKEFTKGR